MKTILLKLGPAKWGDFDNDRRFLGGRACCPPNGNQARQASEAECPPYPGFSAIGGSASGGKFLCITLAMLALAVSPIGAAAADRSDSPAQSESRESQSATNQFLSAYNSMMEADLLKEKGMRADAGELYAEAMKLFLKLAADYPQWQPDVVSFRIDYCRDALVQLKGKGQWRAESRVVETPPEEGQQTTDDRRRTTEDGLKRTTDSRRLMTDDGLPVATLAREGQQTTDIPKSKIENRKSKILALSPLNMKLQQAGLKESERDYAGALAMYMTILEQFPQEPWALKGACRCCLRLGLMDKARALTKHILALQLPDADLNLLAALVACSDGRYQTAINLLHQSLKQNGACPEAHAALGVALAATGDTKEAQEEMKRAITLNPKLGDAYYNLARLSLRPKPTDDKARLNYQLAIDTARVHYQLALRNGAAPDPELDKLLAE